MNSTRLALIGSVFVLAAMPACQGKSAPAPTSTKQAPADAKQARAAPPADATAPVAAPDAAADGGPTPEEIAAIEHGTPPPAPEVSPKDLGARLADPRWYRKTMFGDGAKVLDTKRSTADEQGRFSSLIRFELADMTPEACADHLQKVVAEEVPNVKREVQPNGRVQLEGSTDRYSLTFMCGQADGKTIAFVSYQWT